MPGKQRQLSPTYRTWQSMRNRCLNPKNKEYPRYGGRGIAVCERWNNFELFLEDMGERPPDTSLDRVDNDGPYSPENCRWTDQVTQANNRRSNVRISFNGETRTLSDWARFTGIPYTVLHDRLVKLGWTTEQALSKPVWRGRMITFGGETFSLRQWACRAGIAYSTLRLRLRAGWSVEEALTRPSRQAPT
jgi:hypothetical protein